MVYDFKVALYVCPNHKEYGIHSDHCYLVTVEKLLNSALWKKFLYQEIIEDPYSVVNDSLNHVYMFCLSLLFDTDKAFPHFSYMQIPQMSLFVHGGCFLFQ